MSKYTVLGISFLFSMASASELILKSVENDPFTVVVDTSNIVNFNYQPLLIDDFDIDGIDSTIDLTERYDIGASSATGIPVVQSSVSVTGSNAVLADFVGSNYNSTVEYKTLGGVTTIYLSYYVKVDRLGGDLSRNIKLARLSAGYQDGYLQPTMGYTYFDGNGSSQAYNYNNIDGQHNYSWGIGNLTDKGWSRVEMYIELSSIPGKADGRLYLKINGETRWMESNVVTRGVDRGFEWITFPYYVAHDAGGDYQVYFDNIGAMATQSRVEACSAATFSECGEKFIINATMPNNGNDLVIQSSGREIQGKPQSSYYFYLINDSGEVINSNGVLLTSGSPIKMLPFN